MKAGTRIKVQRTSGVIEDDWYFWTNMSDESRGVTAYIAPEQIACLVIKMMDGSEPVPMDNEFPRLEKWIPYTELIELNK